MEENQEVKPGPERSRQVDNCHYIWCDWHEQRRSYRVCLTLLDDAAHLMEDQDDRSCGRAMCRNACPAVGLLREETEKGESLYYLQRQGSAERPRRQEDEPAFSAFGNRYKAGWVSVGKALGDVVETVKRAIPPRVAVNVPPPPKPKPVFGAMDYADLINDRKPEESTIAKQDYQKMVAKVKELDNSGKKVEARALFDRLMHYKTNNLVR